MLNPFGMTTGTVVPCGKCIVCQTNKAAEWAARLTHELQTSKQACFITLTYNDSYVPMFSDGLLTLWKDDLQRFWKRFRKEYGKGIKYFSVGEYGSMTERPHYHAVIFNWSPKYDDLVPLTSPLGKQYFTLKKLEDLWGYGNCQVGSCTTDSIYYCSGYILKSFLDKTSLGSRTRPFLRVSKGIGLTYAELHADRIHNLQLTAEGKVGPLPRYYIKKLGKVDQDKLVVTNIQRQKAILQRIWKCRDLPDDIRAEAERLVKQARMQNEKEIRALKERLRSKRNL